MNKYKYTAIDANNNEIKGLYLAEDENNLRQALSESGLTLISSKKAGSDIGNGFLSMSFSIKLDEVTTFCRQLSIMISEGIGILDAIVMLSKQPFTSGMLKVIKTIGNDISSGKVLSEAMKKHPKVFPTFFTAMVTIGEASGTLDKVLVEVANYYEQNQKIKKQAMSAMIYPIMVLILTIVVVFAMFLFVVPSFIDVLSDMNIELPAITRIVFGVSQFFVNNLVQIVVAILIVIVVATVFFRTKTGKKAWHTFKAKAPLFKKVNSALVTSKLADGFHLMISSGINIVDAMEILAPVMDNLYYEEKFIIAVKMIRRGVSITDALDSLKIFPATFIQMVAVGEQSGAIDEIMGRTSTHFQEEYTRALKKMTTFIEPALLVFMALMVGAVIISILMPMITMVTAVSSGATAS